MANYSIYVNNSCYFSVFAWRRFDDEPKTLYRIKAAALCNLCDLWWWNVWMMFWELYGRNESKWDWIDLREKNFNNEIHQQSNLQFFFVFIFAFLVTPKTVTYSCTDDQSLQWRCLTNRVLRTTLHLRRQAITASTMTKKFLANHMYRFGANSELMRLTTRASLINDSSFTVITLWSK